MDTNPNINVRETMVDLLCFLKSLYISGNTVKTVSPISENLKEESIKIIENILSYDVILVNKNKLVMNFTNAPSCLDRHAKCVTLKKCYEVESKLMITNEEYEQNIKDEQFRKYLDKQLTNGLVSYFINNVGFTEYDKENK